MKRLVVVALLMVVLGGDVRAADLTWAFSQSDPGTMLPGYLVNDFVIDTGAEQWLSGQLCIELTQGRIYQSPFGGNVPPPSGLLPDHPVVEYDTYISGGTLTTSSQTGSDAGIVGGAVNIGGNIPYTFSDSAVDITWFPSASPGPTGVSKIGRFTLSADAVGRYKTRLGYADSATPPGQVVTVYGEGDISKGVMGPGRWLSDPVCNGSFETGTLDGWNLYGDGWATMHDDDATEGTHSVEIGAAVSGDEGTAATPNSCLWQAFPAKAGQEIRFDCRLEIAGNATCLGATAGCFGSTPRGSLSQYVNLMPCGENWTEFSFTAAENGMYELSFMAGGNKYWMSPGDALSSVRLFIDNVRVVPEPMALVGILSLCAAAGVMCVGQSCRRNNA